MIAHLIDLAIGVLINLGFWWWGYRAGRNDTERAQ